MTWPLTVNVCLLFQSLAVRHGASILVEVQVVSVTGLSHPGRVVQAASIATVVPTPAVLISVGVAKVEIGRFLDSKGMFCDCYVIARLAAASRQDAM